MISARAQEAAVPARGHVRSRDRVRAGICFGVPAVILGVSYVWLAIDRGTLWLWHTIVHESGRYTLGRTIFYFGHFLREIPTDILYALFILAAASGALGAASRAAERETPSRVGRHGGVVEERYARGRLTLLAWAALSTAAVLIAVALFRSAAEQGWAGALRDLYQMRTRDDLVAYGSHWRFHWLSTIWFGAAAALVVPLLAGPWDAVARAPGDRPAVVTSTRLAWGFFVALTLVFGVSTDIFLDVRYAGHQAREIMTHGPITMLLAIGVVRSLAPESSTPRRSMRARAPSHWLAAGAFFIIPLWLAAVTLSGGAMEAGQSDQGLAAMVAGHVFEHVLDYVLVTLLVAGGFAWMSARRAR